MNNYGNIDKFEEILEEKDNNNIKIRQKIIRMYRKNIDELVSQNRDKKFISFLSSPRTKNNFIDGKDMYGELDGK